MSDKSPSKSILDQIEQDARFLRSARMLPDTPLDRAMIDQVARDFKKFIANNDLSLSRVARQLGKGFSQATLSNFINDQKKGDYEKVARGVNRWMENESRKRETRRPEGYVETQAARLMLTVMRTAIESSSIGLITGSAGWGKTLTLRAGHSLYPGSIYARVSMASIKHTGFIKQISRLLGMSDTRALGRLYPAVIDTLRGSGRAIFVDEAHKLGESAIEAIRDIHDETECPIIVCGTIDVAAMVDSRDAFYGQFASRIVARVDLNERASGSGGRRGKQLFTIEDVREVFESGQLRLTDDGARFLCELACVPGLGGLRVCSKIIEIGSRLPAQKGKPLDEAILRKICQQLHGDTFGRIFAERSSRSARRQQEAVA